MTCEINRDTVSNGIKSSASNRMKMSGLFDWEEDNFSPKSEQSDYQSVVDDINKSFQEEIVMEVENPLGTHFYTVVEPSDKLINSYLNVAQSPEVNFSLKSLSLISSEKGEKMFRKGDKNNWSVDKILSELQIPQLQKELILSMNTRNREEIITNLLANYSYTIEINTTNKQSSYDYKLKEVNGKYFISYDDFKTQDEINKATYDGLEIPKTNYYSNLTVPGGTNYIEQELSTPLITPSIKGHAQFSTNNGIGWVRSDDKNPIVKGYSENKDAPEEWGLQDSIYNPITKDDKVIFGHPTIGKSYLKKQGNNDFITLDDDYADEVNAFIDANRGKETRQEYKGRKPKEYNQFMLNLFDRLKLQAKKEGKRLFVSNTNILKERMSDFDKVITIPKDEFKKRFDARGATYGFEDWKSDIDATVAKVDKSKVISTTGYLSDLLEGNPKTRRILEVQSDLFQKGRDKQELIKYPERVNSGKVSLSEVREREKPNQFLQLLNKDNNWVTFFVKSIIQDSAKQTITEVQESDVEAKVRELEDSGLLKIKCD